MISLIKLTKCFYKSGDGGLQRRVLEGITSAVDFLTVLKERMYLNRENMIFLQACLWNIGRRDLHRKCVEFAKSSDKILHFYCPKETPGNSLCLSVILVSMHFVNFLGFVMSLKIFKHLKNLIHEI